jgi:serine/threonine protein kinase
MTCKTTDDVTLAMKCGTPGYTAPEVLRGDPFSVKSDVFSVGCLLFYLVTGRNLYKSKS